MKTIAAVSLGCSKNLVDTEVMLGALSAAGYVPGAEPEEADIIIVNTCAFIRDAIDEAEEVLSEMSAIRRDAHCTKLVVAGCLPQRVGTKLRDQFPDIDLIIGTKSYPDIVKFLEEDEVEGFEPCSSSSGAVQPRLLTTFPWRAYLKIAEGCSNRCAYCLIPSIRGNYKSTPQNILLAEAEGLVELGVSELTLVAQDTTQYGSDLNTDDSLPVLINQLSGIEGLRWIRLLYAYPELVDENLINAMAHLSGVCNYLDMPIQHIDAEILKAMNRRGGPDMVKSAIKNLRNAMPDICLRTTVLVGFPGETDAQFNTLLRFIEETRFDRLVAFAYSPEEGTAAASMSGQVAREVKQERLNTVMELQNSISLENNKALVGNELEVLVEENDVDEDGEVYSVGRTYREAPDIDGLFFLDREEQPGTFVKALVNGAGEYDLRGE